MEEEEEEEEDDDDDDDDGKLKKDTFEYVTTGKYTSGFTYFLS